MVEQPCSFNEFWGRNPALSEQEATDAWNQWLDDYLQQQKEARDGLRAPSTSEVQETTTFP